MASHLGRGRELGSAIYPWKSEEARQGSDSAVAGAQLAGHVHRPEDTTHWSNCGMLADGTQVSERDEVTARPGQLCRAFIPPCCPIPPGILWVTKPISRLDTA